MRVNVRAVIGAVIGIAVVCVIAWLHGFDFNERGPDAVSVFILSAMAGLVGAVLPCVNWRNV